MKISIVTPVYNDPRIRTCLKSVNRQKRNFELEYIVVDGNSTDETVDIIESSENKITCLIREDDAGMYDAINKGISQASGDIVGILNADDRYQDESVLDDVATVMNDQNVDACYGDLVYVDSQNEVVRYWQTGVFRPYKFYMGWMPPHPTFFARKELYDKYGLFDTSFSISADYELMLRFLLKNDISVEYLNRVLVRMTLGGMSNSSIGNMLTVVKDMYDAWEKHDSKGRFVAPFAHPIEKIPQFIRKPPS